MKLIWKNKDKPILKKYHSIEQIGSYDNRNNDWVNEIYHGDNLQVMNCLLSKYRGKINLVYIDPPFCTGKNWKDNEGNIKYTDIWTNDEYLQFMYERLVLIRELLSDTGSIYLHCDYRKSHQLRCLLDEIFGPENFLNSLVWMFTTRSSIKSSWKKTHHNILLYKKEKNPVFNWFNDMVIEPLSKSTISKYNNEDELGKYRLCGRYITNSPIKGAKDVNSTWEKTHPELVVRDYLRKGKVPSDYFYVDIENQASKNRTGYPTQKPDELLYKLILASSKPGDLVFDCYMGSGTTQAVAMKLGRRFIGCDINLDAIKTSTKRLLNTANEIVNKNSQGILELELNLKKEKYYTDFNVYKIS